MRFDHWGIPVGAFLSAFAVFYLAGLGPTPAVKVEPISVPFLKQPAEFTEADWEDVRIAFGDLSTRDLAKALLQEEEPDEMALLELKLAERAQRDPVGAFEEALSYPSDDSSVRQLLLAVVQTIALEDPGQAIELVISHRDKLPRRDSDEAYLLLPAFKSWAKSDLEAMKRELLENPYWKEHSHRADTWSYAAGGSWPKSDRDEWIAFVAELTARSEDQLYLFWRHVHRMDEVKEPLVDISAIESMPASLERDTALLFAFEKLDSAVSERLLPLVSSKYRDSAVARIVRGILSQREHRVLEALQFLGGHTSEEATFHNEDWLSPWPVLNAFERFRPHLDLDAFAKWPSWLQEKIVHRAQFKGDERASMALLIHDASLQAKTLEEHLLEWSQTEPEAASHWITEESHGPERDAAVVGLVRGTVRKDSERAARWAQTLTNPDQRERYTRLAFSYWIEADASAARHAIDTANLSQAARESLLNRINGGGTR
jgi:hypothetical protein